MLDLEERKLPARASKTAQQQNQVHNAGPAPPRAQVVPPELSHSMTVSFAHCRMSDEYTHSFYIQHARLQ